MFSFALVVLANLVMLPRVTRLSAAEILLPMTEPRLPISVEGELGTVQTLGAYRVYQLSGNCVITQGSFHASGDRMQIWVDDFEMQISAQAPSTTAHSSGLSANADVPKQRVHKAVIKIEGNVEVSSGNGDKLKDQRWMGRLFSHRDLHVEVRNWAEARGEPERLNWDESSSVTDATFLAIGKEQGPNSISPAQYTQVPQPQTLMPMELPPPVSIQNQLGPSGTVLDSQMPMGGIVIEGDVPETVKSEIVTSLQPPSSIVPGTGNTSGNGGGPVIVPSSPPQRIGAKTFEFSGRGGIDPQLITLPRPERGDSVVAISRGIRLKFGGTSVMTSSGQMDLGTVLIEADRALIWTSDFSKLISQSFDGQSVELYLEGNVVFQQGQRTIFADRMYYNVQSETGMVLNAEILTPAPQFEGVVRLKADVIEQRTRQNYLAYNAAMTSSRIGVPRYWMQSDRLSLSDNRSEIDPNQAASLAQTGATNMEATARNNFIYLGGVPVLYWPVINTNIDTSSFYLRSIKVKNDEIFGQQAFIDTDLYQLLGIDGPDGTDWLLSTDYLSKRGFALGTTYRYNVPQTFLPGPATGFFDAWGINDRGLDTLGRNRVGLAPERETRGRLTFRHRQFLTPDLELWAEAGVVSDRNFLEQYFEREWDQEKDLTTSLRLRRYFDNQMFDIVGQPRINRFFTETEWLPRIDHYLLGQPLFNRLTWYARSNVAYAHQRVLTPPQNASELARFQFLPWERDTEGIRAGTRQEIALPLELGPAKAVPYLNGEVMTWGNDLNGESSTRLTGQVGVRSSLPFWRVFPETQSRLFNVNGIAHKVSLNSEFFYADTNKDLTTLPLYDPLDDNAQEAFRRRLVFNTFGNGVLPDQFDSRTYAVRQGLQRYVTAGSQEIVEDQMQFRLGLDQRWQTKRGLPGKERITDLVEFDVDAILFPKQDRDNFGSTVGAINYDARYHIGDRVSLLSDGYFDVFDRGLKVISGGAMMTRPGRGEWYFGLTSLRGPINSLVAISNYNYRLNEKWMTSGGTTFDFGQVGNVGQSFSVTRIGESFLVQVGASVDSGRSNTTFFFNVEPRFFSLKRIGGVGGQPIPPAGLFGLE